MEIGVKARAADWRQLRFSREQAAALAADLRQHAAEIDIPRALEIEAEIQHDLMAEVRVFAEQASVGGGIPIIRALREGLAANRITEIFGIINGTCNYILSRMTYESLGFDEALKPLRGPKQAVRYSVRDYWGAEQFPAGRQQGIVRPWEGDLVDHHEAQRAAGNVDALEEARRSEQARARVLAECLHERGLGEVALRVDVVVDARTAERDAAVPPASAGKPTGTSAARTPKARKATSGSATESVATTSSVPATYAELPLNSVVPNPRQPRAVFDDDELAEEEQGVGIEADGREHELVRRAVERRTGRGLSRI